jgi:hypothetical protein
MVLLVTNFDTVSTFKQDELNNVTLRTFGGIVPLVTNTCKS